MKLLIKNGLVVHPVTGVTLPDPEGAAFYDKQFTLYRRIQAALAPIYHDL